jgi:hypothetical protein
MATDYLSIGANLSQNRTPFNYEKVEQIARDISTAWLTLEEITQQLNLVDDESQDSFLSGLEIATRMAIEDYLGMAIFPVQYRVYYANPAITGTAVGFDLPEVTQGLCGIKINSVGFWNGDTPSVFTPIDPTTYQYDATGNQVILNSLPSNLSTQITNPIVVTYTSQANPLSAYPVIKQAGLLMLTHLYNNRSNTIQGSLNEIPFGVAALLRPYKPLVM